MSKRKNTFKVATLRHPWAAQLVSAIFWRCLVNPRNGCPQDIKKRNNKTKSLALKFEICWTEALIYRSPSAESYVEHQFAKRFRLCTNQPGNLACLSDFSRCFFGVEYSSLWLQVVRMRKHSYRGRRWPLLGILFRAHISQRWTLCNSTYSMKPQKSNVLM